MKHTSLKLAFTLFAPLAMFGCGATQNDRVSSFEEIKNALSFANVEYLQADIAVKDSSSDYTRHIDTSPYISYDSREPSKKQEEYAEKTQEEGYFVYTKDDKDIWRKESAFEESFRRPWDISKILCMNDAVESCKDYSDYKYADGKYTCEWRRTDGAYYRLTCKFSNKKIVSAESIFIHSGSSSFKTATIKYKNYTPTLPDVPDSDIR